MALSRALTSAVALAVAALLVIGGGGVAVADQLEIDGDGVTPVTSNAASITACTDKPVQLTVLIAARRNGNPNTNTTNNVFRNGADVTVGFVSGTAGLTASLADGVIGLENTWQN